MDLSFPKSWIREHIWALGLTFFYMSIWWCAGYALSSEPGFLGLPMWFEWSCLYLPVGFVGMISWVLTRVFIPAFHEEQRNDRVIDNELNAKGEM